MREILSDIFTWPWFSQPHGYNFNGHLVRHAEGNLCIDPVEPDEEVVDEIARLGVAQILLTNRNHSRAANTVRRHTGARTAIHLCLVKTWSTRLIARWSRADVGDLVPDSSGNPWSPLEIVRRHVTWDAAMVVERGCEQFRCNVEWHA